MKRYLLCRPEGGLNDMLCQIGKCMVYAREHGRQLVIDTRNTQYRDDLGRYLSLTDRNAVYATPTLLEQLGKLPVRPATLAGRLHDYPCEWHGPIKLHITSDTREPLSFDFSKEHDEPLLVHHTCGGGLESLHALEHMQLTPTMIKRLRERRAAIGGDYTGIHVRHTDYRTDVAGFFSKLAGRIPQDRILLCTDNREVLNYAREFFRKPVFSFAWLPDLGGRPLHYGHVEGKRRINSDSLLDLLLLAHARTLFISPIHRGHYSGFSELARELHASPNRRNALLDTAPGARTEAV